MYEYLVDDHYIFDNWMKFTTLTDEEMSNLEKILNHRKIKNNKNKIICNETKETFCDVENLASILQISKPTLYKYIKLNAHYWGKNEYYLGKSFSFCQI